MFAARLSNPRVMGTRVVVDAKFFNDEKELASRVYPVPGSYDRLADTIRQELEIMEREAPVQEVLKEVRTRLKDGGDFITLPVEEEETKQEPVTPPAPPA